MRLERPELQPLPAEVFDEPLDLPVLQHALHLRIENLRPPQMATGRNLGQLVIGHARPQEVREARRQLVIVQIIRIRDGRRGRPRWLVALDAEEKARRHEHGLHGDDDLFVERIASLPGALGVRHNLRDLAPRHGPAIRAPCEILDDAAEAAGGALAAHEQLPRALGRRPGFGIVRPADFDRLHAHVVGPRQPRAWRRARRDEKCTAGRVVVIVVGVRVVVGGRGTTSASAAGRGSCACAPTTTAAARRRNRTRRRVLCAVENRQPFELLREPDRNPVLPRRVTRTENSCVRPSSSPSIDTAPAWTPSTNTAICSASEPGGRDPLSGVARIT